MSKLAVVCSNGVGTSTLIAKRLGIIFPEHSFDHYALAEFKTEKYHIVITFEAMVDSVRAKSSRDQKIKTYEGLFNALGRVGTMESRLNDSSTDSERIEALREYLFSDALDREDF
jgi:galactitol-specific phosphotransferase system IIB component